MNKKILGSIFIFLFVVITIVLLGYVMKQNQVKAEERRVAMEKRLHLYSASLCIDGNFVIDEDNVIINNKTWDEKELIKWVALHNAFYKDLPVTIEELMTEFDAFCSEMDESELLEGYRDRMSDIVVRAENVELFVNGYDYDRVIIDYLKEKFETELSDATKEQMEEVCPYAAQEFYEQVLELEKPKDN